MSTTNVCCLCGDIGFPDKLFRCNKCCNRLQHSYCSNYYDDSTSAANVSCDWCLHEERSSTTAATSTSGKKQISSAKRSSPSSGKDRREYNSSGEKIKQNDNRDQRHHKESTTSTDQKGKNGGIPSPRTAARRYKFLKDVIC
ncbi:hypothetical protein MKW94_018912 [Papaver nudicaule]|uniref:PHD-type zinc finger plants domain-containing protein n=1 Tax=Papaver nudicaule TaxID=74823 RepID=A0AA41RZA1_PAPNU|nr:hypothetical protein [Papaver nudicaule]